jgi:hypothetical protein
VLIGAGRCSLVLIGAHWCSLVLVGAHWCSLVLIAVNGYRSCIDSNLCLWHCLLPVSDHNRVAMRLVERQCFQSMIAAAGSHCLLQQVTHLLLIDSVAAIQLQMYYIVSVFSACWLQAAIGMVLSGDTCGDCA